MSDVRVQLRESDGEDGERPGRFIRVVLYSRKVVPGQPYGRHKSYRDIYPQDFGSESDMRREVENTGGALAEYQCENYGDAHDPEECAKAALEAFEELRANAEQAKIDQAIGEGRSER